MAAANIFPALNFTVDLSSPSGSVRPRSHSKYKVLLKPTLEAVRSVSYWPKCVFEYMREA